MTAQNHSLKSINKKLNTISAKQYIVIVLVLISLNALVISITMRMNYYKAQSYSVVGLGEDKTINKITLNVSNLKTETGYVMGITPAKNEEIISLKFTITNNSDNNYDIYPSIQTFIRDNEGDSYTMIPVALSNPLTVNTVKPGETASGQLSYKVSSRAVPLYLYVESKQPMIAPFIVNIRP